MMNKMEWLSRLISFDTTSRNSNLTLIKVIQDWLEQHGLICRLTHDETKQKANLFATLPAQDGSLVGGIILSGHTDVVPVDGQDWKTNPFEATMIDGKVYGRGTCDMKGFLAVALSLVPEFKKLNLQQPVHFAFSYDEEVGCRGAPLLIADLIAAGIKPSACIVGEPSNMRAVIAHKGIQVYRCSVHGFATHSSLLPQGCNAIEYAAQLICHIRDVMDEIKQYGPYDEDYDVPYSTMTTSMIKGGIAHNTIPSLCEFTYELRNLPQVDPQKIRQQIDAYVKNDLLPKMRMEYKEAAILIDTIAAAPGLDASEEAALTVLARAIAGDEHKKHKVAYATEAGLFQRAEIPTIVCGPGNIEQAHRANEFVAVEQLERCEGFLRRIVSQF